MGKEANKLTEKEFLQQYNLKDYEHSGLSVDSLVFTISDVENNNIRKLNEKRLQILLVKRKEHPYIGLWALPGTFLLQNETLEEAYMRSLKNKAKFDKAYLEQLYTFDDIKRDPRGRILTVAYMGLIPKPSEVLDKNAGWFDIKDLKSLKIAFDHVKIIDYGLQRLKNKIEWTDIAFSMLPKEFTKAELQQVFEIILDKKLTKANFQRKIKDRIKSVSKFKTGGFRPAELFEYKRK